MIFLMIMSGTLWTAVSFGKRSSTFSEKDLSLYSQLRVKEDGSNLMKLLKKKILSFLQAILSL